jgi:hypothetical protein
MTFKRWITVIAVVVLALVGGGFVYAEIDDGSSSADDAAAPAATTTLDAGGASTSAPSTTPQPAGAPPASTAPMAVSPPSSAQPTTTTAPVAPPTSAADAAPADRPVASSSAFSETFDTAAGFYERFDYGFSGYDPAADPEFIESWSGDHDAACAAPATKRDVHIADKEELFWWCGPRPDAPASSGHLMTSVDTLGYNIAWFSPRQWFEDVTSVCWDQNMTDMGGRKWINVALVARSDVEHYQENPENGNSKGHLDLGFTDPDFRDPGGPTTRIHPQPGSGTVGVFNNRGFMVPWDEDGFDRAQQISGPYENEDLSGRYQQCIADNGDGSITLTQGRDDGVLTQVVDGITFPDGEVRVVFLDDNYNPQKDEDYDPAQNTWHWDNISVSVA